MLHDASVGETDRSGHVPRGRLAAAVAPVYRVERAGRVARKRVQPDGFDLADWPPQHPPSEIRG